MNDDYSKGHYWALNEVPQTKFAGLNDQQWLSTDSESAFDKNKPNGWSKDSITYNLNKHGYRSDEFIDDERFTIVNYGCSSTLGVGVKHEDVWTHKLSTKIQSRNGVDVKTYNLGVGGASMDMICRTIYQTLPILKPDLIFVLFTNPYRFEFQDDDGFVAQIIAPDKDTEKLYETVANQYSCENNFYKNFYIMEAMFARYNKPWLFSSTIEQSDILSTHDNFAGYFDDHYKTNDYARDLRHAGIKTHDNMAENFFNTYKQFDKMDNAKKIIDFLTNYIGEEWLKHNNITISKETTFSELNFDLFDESATIRFLRTGDYCMYYENNEWFHAVSDLIDYVIGNKS